MTIKISCSEFSKASPEIVWNLWSTTASWSSWDHGVAWCRLKEGHKFQVGGEAFLLPKGASTPVSVRITECTLNKSFTDVGDLELGTLQFKHTLEPQEGGVLISHFLEFTPAHAQAEQIFRTQMLPKLEIGLPMSVRSLARLAEEEQASLAEAYHE